ncbi:MAG: helix-turn-helix transcriptional regulator [Rhodospirillaceae bacterium]|nr:helix-turn-helix transcriptional regulator [Rhodospirillaceae bacterium]
MSKIVDTSQFSQLIERMYAAVLEPVSWLGIAPEIAALCGTHSATIQVRNIKSGAVELLSRTANGGEGTDKAYLEYYHAHDVWATLGMASGMGGVIAGETLISDRDLEETEFFQDFLRKLDIFQIIGAVLRLDNDHVGMIGVHRPRAADPFNAQQKNQLEAVLPHLQRALQLRLRLPAAGAVSSAIPALPESEGLSVLLTDANGRILHANAEAETLLRQGEALRSTEGMLTAHHMRTNLRLQRLMKDAAQTAALRTGTPGGFLSVPRPDRFPLAVLVSPFQAALNPGAAAVPSALVLIRDPAQSAELNPVLQSLFGLTPAEAKIANGLAGGASIDEIAARHGLSHHTVRTQLKSISAKTGTSRQGELIALILKATSFPKV